MAEWKREIIGLAPILAAYYDDDEVGFEETRDKAVALFEKDRAYWSSDHDEFTDAVEMLRGSEDIEEFNEWLGAIYDWADAELVWINPTR